MAWEAKRTASRQIDQIPVVPPRLKEMQVLCLGLSRTATKSMYTALQKLGYNPYHGSELFKGINSQHVKFWQEALTDRYHTGKSIGLIEFEKLLANYDAVTDAPCANFTDELTAAYPKAKVILTTRDPDSWVRSMNSSYYRILDMLQWWNPLVHYDPNFWGAFGKLVRILLMEWTSGDVQNRSKLRRGFVRHNEHVRNIIPKDNLLEFRPGDGWEALCGFLGKELPSEPFPHVNDGGQAADAVRFVIVFKLIQMSAITVAVVAAGWVAWSWGRSQKI